MTILLVAVALVLLGIATGTALAYRSPLYGATLRELAAWGWAAQKEMYFFLRKQL